MIKWAVYSGKERLGYVWATSADTAQEVAEMEYGLGVEVERA